MKSWSKSPCCSTPLRTSLLGGSYFYVFQCRKCGRTFCHHCGLYGPACPCCGQDNKETVGKVYAE